MTVISKATLNKYFLPLLIIFLAAQELLWMSSSEAPLLTAIPYRIVTTGLLIFFGPGWLLSKILKVQRMPLPATIAVSGALSMCFAAILLPIPFLLTASVKVYISLYLFVLICMSALVALRLNNTAAPVAKQAARFSLYKLVMHPDFFHFGVILLISIAAYGFGESIWDIGGEKFQHMQFIRLYFGMPARLDSFGLLPNMTPPNIVYFWEYMVAAWATAAHTDPLPVFEHVRFIIPLLGLPSMYLLVWAIFSKCRANQCFSVILLLVLGSIFLVLPTSISFVQGSDITRGLFLFYGTVHHADPAMDVLNPLLAALLWLSLSTKRWIWRSLLIGILFVAFLWHPREFFQLALTFPLVVLAFLMNRQLAPSSILKRTFLLGIGIAMVAIVFFISIKIVSPLQSGTDEFQIKKAAFSSMASKQMLLGFRDAFTFPTHFMLNLTSRGGFWTAKEQYDHLYSEFRQEAWLLLAGVAQIILVIWGTRRARTVATVHMLIWGLLLWNAACLFAIIATYSEILMTTPRILYIFSYIVIAEALLILAQRYGSAMGRYSNSPVFSQIAIPLFMFFAAGMIFSFRSEWMSEAMLRMLSSVLGLSILAGLIYVVFNRSPGLSASTRARPYSLLWLALCSMFLLPAFWPEYLSSAQLFLSHSRAATAAELRNARLVYSTAQLLALPETPKPFKVPLRNEKVIWFSENNPFKLSSAMISTLRTLPQGSIISAFPADTPFFFLYAPVYVIPYPLERAMIPIFNREDNWIKNGSHPVFGNDQPSLEKVLSYLKQNQISHIAIQRSNYNRLSPFFLSHLDNFTVLLNDIESHELLIKVNIL